MEDDAGHKNSLLVVEYLAPEEIVATEIYGMSYLPSILMFLFILLVDSLEDHEN